jgi:hypothetical protein
MTSKHPFHNQWSQSADHGGKGSTEEGGAKDKKPNATQEKTSAAELDMEIDGADGVAASGLAAGTVGDGAVEDGQSSAVPGDSRPNKRQRREEEGRAGEAAQRRHTKETACAWWLHHMCISSF